MSEVDKHTYIIFHCIALFCIGLLSIALVLCLNWSNNELYSSSVETPSVTLPPADENSCKEKCGWEFLTNYVFLVFPLLWPPMHHIGSVKTVIGHHHNVHHQPHHDFLRNRYNPTLACQCNSLCPEYKNCCSDYNQLCANKKAGADLIKTNRQSKLCEIVIHIWREGVLSEEKSTNGGKF